MEHCYIWGLSTIYPNGYNFESGGNKNKRISEETRRKLSESKRGKKHFMYGKCHLEETKSKMSIAHIGIKHTAESRKKISESRIGKRLSKGTKKKMSIAHIGMKFSYETKSKMSLLRKGVDNPNTKLSGEQVLEIRYKYSSGNYTQKNLSKEYKVTVTNICSIVNRRSWKHI